MFGFGKKAASITADELAAMPGKVNIIDVREKYECAAGMLKGAINVPVNTLLSNVEKYLKKGETYYIVCHSGGRSSQVCSRLSGMGYDVVNVRGGMMSYRGRI